MAVTHCNNISETRFADVASTCSLTVFYTNNFTIAYDGPNIGWPRSYKTEQENFRLSHWARGGTEFANKTKCLGLMLIRSSGNTYFVASS